MPSARAVWWDHRVTSLLHDGHARTSWLGSGMARWELPSELLSSPWPGPSSSQPWPRRARSCPIPLLPACFLAGAPALHVPAAPGFRPGLFEGYILFKHHLIIKPERFSGAQLLAVPSARCGTQSRPSPPALPGLHLRNGLSWLSWERPP